MKRNLILVGIFAAILSILFCSSCSCYIPGEEDPLRGVGQMCNQICSGCGGASCANTMDCIFPSFQIAETYEKENSFIAIEGVDYTKPTIEFLYKDGRYSYKFSTNILNLYSTQVSKAKYSIEVCLVQNGVLVGRAGYTGNIYETGVLEITSGFNMNEFYSDKGPEPECILNAFSLKYIK